MTNLVVVLGSIHNLDALSQTLLVFLVQHSKQWLERSDACKPLQRNRDCEDRMHIAQRKTLVGELQSKRKRGLEAEIIVKDQARKPSSNPRKEGKNSVRTLMIREVTWC
jgi:hypothetical protein